jgi:hypothetical protein
MQGLNTDKYGSNAVIISPVLSLFFLTVSFLLIAQL